MCFLFSSRTIDGKETKSSKLSKDRGIGGFAEYNWSADD